MVYNAFISQSRNQDKKHRLFPHEFSLLLPTLISIILISFRQDTDASFIGEFSPGFTIKPVTTQYVCQAMDIGLDVRHITAIEPIYQDTSGAPYIHHIIVHVCGSDEDSLLEKKLFLDFPHPCQEELSNHHGAGYSPTGEPFINRFLLDIP